MNVENDTSYKAVKAVITTLDDCSWDENRHANVAAFACHFASKTSLINFPWVWGKLRRFE